MARKITKIAVGIAVTLGTLLGLATAVMAEDKNRPPTMLPPKSCTWVAAEAKDTSVVASGGTHTETSGAKWKCNNGSWKQVGGPPAKDTRPK
jgi:hypothetical protein